MAIERTVFTAATAAARATEIGAWLTANASDYFDTVVVDGTTITCTIGGNTALVFTTTSLTLYTKSGISTSSIQAVMGTAWLYGIKTSKGIALYYKISSNIGSIFLAKSNANSNIILVKYNTSWRAYDFENSPSITSYSLAAPTTSPSGSTVLVPIVGDGVATYSDSIYFMFYNQFPNTEGNIIVNNVTYYTDGYYALKE